MCIEHLTAKELSERWHLSSCTLERWRREGLGPQFLKVGQRILYRISDVQTYEQKRSFTGNGQPAGECAPCPSL